MCLKVSSADLGFWVGCSGNVLVLDHLWTLLFTETTRKQCPGRRKESHREHPQRLSFSYPCFNTHAHTRIHTNRNVHTRRCLQEPWPPMSPMVIFWDKTFFLTPSLMNSSSAGGFRHSGFNMCTKIWPIWWLKPSFCVCRRKALPHTVWKISEILALRTALDVREAL